MKKEDKKRILLFSIQHNDFELQFFRASGPGGQQKNKVETACRIIHKASGAVAYATEHKSQSQNREAAFHRLVNSKEFKSWHKLEVSRRLFNYQSIEDMLNKLVDKAMDPANIKLEVQDGKGRWIEINHEDLLKEDLENIDLDLLSIKE